MLWSCHAKELKVVIAVVVAVALFEGQQHILRTAKQKKSKTKQIKKLVTKKSTFEIFLNRLKTDRF